MIQIIAQWEHSLDVGAESIGYASDLLWRKSRALLQRDVPTGSEPQDPEEFPLPLLEQLVEYCRFKEIARVLSVQEEKALTSYSRQPSVVIPLMPSGIDHLSLSDLAALFQVAIAKATIATTFIEKDIWEVADKIVLIQNALQDKGTLSFEELLNQHQSKQELIVLFLALLELMKSGRVSVIREGINLMLLDVYEDRKG